MNLSLRIRGAIVSLLILGTFLFTWHIAVSGTGATQAMDPEYAKLMGL